jgi:succinate dehydrogenase / fumarate reductase membrane anchor subunit
MQHHPKSLRSPLGRVRGLGSAKGGTHHWWMQRVTAVILAIVSLYVLWGFFAYAVPGGYDGASYWLREPLTATFVFLFLVVSLYHATLGLQVVIEDYVHAEGIKLLSIILIKFIAGALGILGVIALLKILFGV